MTQDVLARLEHLREDFAQTEGQSRSDFLNYLADASKTLRASGYRVPAWVRHELASAEDEALEDQFDNLPV